MKRRRTEALSASVIADTTPLRAMASNGISHVVRRPHDRLIVLKPVTVVPWVGAFVGMVLVAVGATIYFRSGHSGGLFVGGIGAVFAAAFSSIALFTRRFEFDLDGGLLRVSRVGACRRYPLERVQAIQLIEGGWHGTGNRPKFFTYQLNIVLDDPNQQRVNLTNVSNWDATWTMGSELAEFLGVPWLDQVTRK